MVSRPFPRPRRSVLEVLTLTDVLLLLMAALRVGQQRSCPFYYWVGASHGHLQARFRQDGETAPKNHTLKKQDKT